MGGERWFQRIPWKGGVGGWGSGLGCGCKIMGKDALEAGRYLNLK